MILDNLSNASVYRQLGPRIARGFAWLAEFSPQTADGRYEIDGDNIYALVQSYDTSAPEQKKYESHRTYLDIQFVVDGAETIHYAPVEKLRPVMEYDATKDYLLYADAPGSTPLHLGPGSFAIFYPGDGHKPGCHAGGAATRIKKVVIKARV